MSFFDIVVLFFLANSAVSLTRVIIGPSVVDRMIGLNVTTVGVLAVLVLIAVKQQAPV